jgi:serine/threonine protein kinase
VIIAHDVALGLGAAHRRRIVHRDVKPQNVLVGRGGSIKLTDFGIASVYKDMNAERLTTTGMTLGTVQYYAPEQAQGEIVTPAADVYALGIVMYEMLTGHPPFDGDTPVAVAMQHIQDVPIPPSQFNPSIPAALEEMILRCLEKVPEMRFQDGSQLARALESLGDQEPGETVGPFTPGHTPVPITYTQIPPRPSTSGRNPARDSQQRSAAPAPEPMLNGGGSSSRYGAGAVHVSEDDRTVPLGQQRYSPPTYAPEPGTSRLDQRGTVPRSGALPQDRRETQHFASIITVLILLATLLLLGFSIYLAVQLGFISLPFFNSGSTPTPGVVYDVVPDLRGLSWSEAQDKATKAGFNLQLSIGSTSISGIVKLQSYKPGDKAPKGTILYVTMEPKTNKIPPISPGTTLGPYEYLLQQLGFNNYIVKPDGTDPNLQPNAVSRVNPSPGISVAVDSQITIYVKNYTSGSPVVTPTLSPTAKPSPSPSPTPSPTPSPSPSPTPSPTPSPSPTVGPSPTPT